MRKRYSVNGTLLTYFHRADEVSHRGQCTHPYCFQSNMLSFEAARCQLSLLWGCLDYFSSFFLLIKMMQFVLNSCNIQGLLTNLDELVCVVAPHPHLSHSALAGHQKVVRPHQSISHVFCFHSISLQTTAWHTLKVINERKPL